MTTTAVRLSPDLVDEIDNLVAEGRYASRSEAAIPVMRTLLVAPVTRRVRVIPTQVLLDADDGMSVECAVSLDNVTVADRTLLTGPSPNSRRSGRQKHVGRWLRPSAVRESPPSGVTLTSRVAKPASLDRPTLAPRS